MGRPHSSQSGARGGVEMIHDAIVPVTCDNEDCKKSSCNGVLQVGIEIPFVIYHKHPYITDKLGELGWIITVNNRHYCSEACASEAEDGKG